MKKYLIITVIILSGLFTIFSDKKDKDDSFKEAKKMFNKGKYRDAISMYEDVKKRKPNSKDYWEAELEIMINSYYDMDISAAIRKGEMIINAKDEDVSKIDEFYNIKFLAYWWTW